MRSKLPLLRNSPPAHPGTAAAEAQPAFEAGDKIVAIDGTPVTQYVDIHRQLALHPDEPLHLVVERKVPPVGGGKSTTGEPVPAERVAIVLPPQPMYRLGLVMKMGPITAVQSQSPAAEAGVQPGDVLTEIDGKPAGDPVTLADRLRRRALHGERVGLSVDRNGQTRHFENVLLRQADWYEWPILPWSPMTVPALGIAYEVQPIVASVVKGSPADQAGVAPGDEVLHAKVNPPTKEQLAKLLGDAGKDVNPEPIPIDFQKKSGWFEKKITWPYFFFSLLNVEQDGEMSMLPGTTIELTLAGGRSVTLTPSAAEGWFNPNRGLIFKAKGSIVGGWNLASMVRLGYQETRDSLMMVFRFLSKVGSQVSVKNMGGPISIFRVAYSSAAEGFSVLLLFLTMISANLAVINFLPIPVLDGGHMVFLIYEGVTGRTPDERVQAALTWAGLIFILGLMICVFGLDIGRLLHW